MKVRVCRQFKFLEGVFDKGDEVEVTPILVEETTIHKRQFYQYVLDDKGARRVLIEEEEVIEKGTFVSYTIESKNGLIYGEESIRNMIGPLALNEIFVKI